MNFKFPQFTPMNLSSIVTQAGHEGIQIMSDMMNWNPAKRPTASQCLKWVNTLWWKWSDIVTSTVPVFPNLSDHWLIRKWYTWRLDGLIYHSVDLIWFKISTIFKWGKDVIISRNSQGIISSALLILIMLSDKRLRNYCKRVLSIIIKLLNQVVVKVFTVSVERYENCQNLLLTVLVELGLLTFDWSTKNTFIDTNCSI